MTDKRTQGRERFQAVTRGARGYWLSFWRLLWAQFNKNIYTRVIFTNVAVFAVGLIALMILSSFAVKQATSELAEEELLDKAKRVNYALTELTDQLWGTTFAEHTNGRAQERQDFIQFLADIYDTRITIFDGEGQITDTSARQEVGPGSKVEENYLRALSEEEITIIRTENRETDRLTLAAVVPMGNNGDTIDSGILLEARPAGFSLAADRLRLFQVIGGTIILVILIIASIYLATYISRPISRLATSVAEIGSGGSMPGIENQSLDEINTLAAQLDKLAQKLERIQVESKKMEEDRSRLFAEISHELRTPLTAVQGFIEAIRDGMVRDKAVFERYLDTIYLQTVHITRLVDDILALSRLESGTVTVEKLPVDLIALTRGVAASMEDAARSKNNAIQLEKKSEEAVVLGDTDRMEQIIRNLIKNAIYATENGTIKVSVDTKQDEVLLTVEDDGTGIASDDLPHIWERFYRVKTQRGEHIGEKGTGLGLVIVKKLVQLQNGKIEVASQLGQGTTFSISFPRYD